MPTSGIITLPSVRGALGSKTKSMGLYLRAGWKVQPYQLGAFKNGDESTATINVQGQGQFSAGEYVMAATKDSDSGLYKPDTGRIDSVSSVSGSADQITLNNALVLLDGEYLVNLGSGDTASPSSTVTPNYDGSLLTVYSDPVGESTISTGILTTKDNGFFEGWVESGTLICDLIIRDTSGTVRAVWPHFVCGPEIVV